MREVLIIRSVSFQQLDNSLPKIMENFPDCKISILTHPHGVKLAEKYSGIYRVYSYDAKGSFSRRRKAYELQGKTFEAIVVPVGNLSGLGFHNVLLFSLTLQGRKRWICNLISDMREISPLEIRVMSVKNTVYRALSVLLTGIAAVGMILALPYMLLKINGRKKENTYV